MGFIIKINNSIVVDGTEFESYHHNNMPNFDFDDVGNFLEPRSANEDNLLYSGYNLNVKSTIFADSKSTEVIDGYRKITNSDKNSSISQGYLEMEIVYYELLLKGYNSYFFPTHELLKLFYWFSKSVSIMNSERKLKKIKDEILAKAEHLNTFSLASESMRSYQDLLNSTCDLYSELMFASICKTKGMDVKLNEVNDFLIDHQIAEVKSIHDDYNRAHFDRNDDLLTKSITNSYRIEDLQDEISTQLVQPKWHDHLSKAISKQKGKIVFVNATQSPNLDRISVFIEEHNLRRDIKKILNNAMEFMDKKDVLPGCNNGDNT